MLLFVLRKMLHNKWMVFCLTIGSILVAATVAIVPIYTEGVLQRMLIKDLEQSQTDSKVYAGRYSVSGNLYHSKESERLSIYYATRDRLEEYMAALDVPVQALYHQITVDYVNGYNQRYRGREDDPGFRRIHLTMDSLVDGRDKIRITHGRAPSNEVVDGDMYEVIITAEALDKTGMTLNEVYIMKDSTKRRVDQEFRIHVVGVFEPTDYNDLYWLSGTSKLKENVLMDYDLLMSDFIDCENSMLTSAYWYYALDYHAISISQVARLSLELSSQIEHFAKRTPFGISVASKPILDAYVIREQQLRTMIWVVQAPVLVLLSFYLFMVAQLIVDYERVEISVLGSRGASRAQVIGTYFLQGVTVSLIALIAGPPLGLELSKILGASNGFLEFVQRKALPVKLSSAAYLYALTALVLSIGMMVVPAVNSARATVVEQRRKRGRYTDVPLWKKLLLDFIFIGASLYGLFQFRTRSGIMAITGAGALDVPIDPFLFLMSTLFILGCGMLILRIYPFFIRALFWLGRRFWSPQLYAAFIQVGRSRGQEQFLMLFLIFTLSVGIFSANASRTINANEEDRIWYANGADLIIESMWSSNASMLNADGGPDSAAGPADSVLIYREPPLDLYESVTGIERIARVYVRPSVDVNIMGGGLAKAYYQAVVPDEFSDVVWSRNDLLPWHINHVLNYLAQTPNAVFISSNFADKGVKPGDTLYLSWNNQQIQTQVAGFISYWPSINPYIIRDNDTANQRNFIIGNMDYMFSIMAMDPYQIWAKRQEGVSTETIYESIAEKKLLVNSITDSHRQLIDRKNDPLLQGLNGALTMSFVVTMAISAVGFIIYWVLSIKSRVLQFGVFRAMGMRLRNLISMLFTEQLMISFTAILCGVIIGGIASDLFVPMMSVTYSAAQQIPPFLVTMNVIDYNRIYLIVGAMLIAGFTILGTILSRLNVTQVLKLGED